MRSSRFLSQPATVRCGSQRLILAIALLLLPAAALALSLSTPFVSHRAFSPNGDGSQDEITLHIVADGEAMPLDSLFVGFYAAAADSTPPSADDLMAWPPVGSEFQDANQLTRDYVWDGRSGAGEAGDALLPEGFYYLYVRAATAADTLWLDPPIQIELNTAPPTFHSLALEPAGYFAPLAAGADTLLQVLFNSADFDTLTDTASAEVYYRGPEDPHGAPDAILERDPAYFQANGELGRYRLLWDGADGEGQRLDGLYRIDITLEDDAGNPPDFAQIETNLDVLAPSLTVIDFGGPLESGALSFTLHPDALPDSLVVRAQDRNGLSACVAALDSAVVFDQVGTLLPESGFEEAFYSFPLPAGWGGPGDSLSLHRLYLDAEDMPGNTNGALGSSVSVSIHLDAEAPSTPVWTVAQTAVLQRVVTLSGIATGSPNESSLSVEVSVNGEAYGDFATDITGEFLVVVDLEDADFFPAGAHSSTWTAVAVDPAGNRSETSEPLTIDYDPEPAQVIPGRWRGRPGESFQINTAADARGIRIRIYGLDGELHRILDLTGGPRQFSGEWNLKDAGGRDLLDGLYVLNIATTLDTGEVEHEREVVAIVRD